MRLIIAFDWLLDFIREEIRITMNPGKPIFRIIDSAAVIYSMVPTLPRVVHVPPIIFFDSLVIVSTIESDDRRESSETLSFQGLPSSVWALVSFSLLFVSGLAAYLSFKNEKNNGKKRPFDSWINCVWIYAADILNNCVAGVLRQGPETRLRSWWLLGVVFLTQFWIAGIKRDLLVGNASFVDSFEDLLSKPELLCLIQKRGADPFRVTKDEPRYQDYRNIKKRYVNGFSDENSFEIFSSGSGVIMEPEHYFTDVNQKLIKKLNETKRKKYASKKKYCGQYYYMRFNKRLPGAIKEDIDYLTSRLTETRQTEPRSRFKKFRTREFIFHPTENISWSAQSVAFLSPLFRAWIIGITSATFVLCVEFFRSRASRRRRVKVSPHHSIGIWIRA